MFTHLWFDPAHRWPSLKGGIPCCYLCGAVKRSRGPSSACRGIVRVKLRPHVLSVPVVITL